jgi:hypothetical protein
VAITDNPQVKRPLFSRSGTKENSVAHRRRLLAERAGFLASSIYLFENRDPAGDLLDANPSVFSEAELSGRFAKKFKRRLRGLFTDLKREALVDDDDLTLFYWAQTAEARMRLASRLRQVAEAAANEV